MGRRLSGRWCLTGFMAIALKTHGEAAAQAPPTLHEVLAVALAHNPDIQAARATVDSARGEQRIARALPNPALSAAPNSPYQYGVSLPLDLGPSRFFRTRASGAGRAATEEDLAEVTRQVVFAVRGGFYELLEAEADRDTAREERDIFAQLLQADSVRLEHGDIPLRNVNKSALELARAEAALSAAVTRLHAARLSLQALMGVSGPDTGFTVEGSLAYRPLLLPEDSLLAIARAHRPDLAAARAREAQSASLRALARGALLPVPTLSLVWQPDGRFTPATFWTFGSSHRLSLGLGLTLPLFNWYGGERQRAQAGLDAASAVRRRVELAVETEVLTAHDAFVAARAQAERYEDGLLAGAARGLADARYAYGVGALSLLELLDAVRTYAEVRREAAAARHDYWVSAAALTRALGTDLETE